MKYNKNRIGVILFPSIVYAEDILYTQDPIIYGLERISYLANDASSNYPYAKSYTYNDGIYTLTGEIRTSSLDFMRRFQSSWLSDMMYTCKDSTATSCETLYVAFPSQYTQINSNTLAISITNGEEIEDVRYLIYASSFERKDGKYHLLEEEAFDLSTILKQQGTLSQKYTCLSESTIEGIVGNKMGIKKYINNTSEIRIIDEDIMNIQDNEMVFLRKGETDIVQASQPEKVLYHVVVKNINTTKKTETNPKTGKQNVLILIVTLVTIIGTIFKLKKQ